MNIVDSFFEVFVIIFILSWICWLHLVLADLDIINFLIKFFTIGALLGVFILLKNVKSISLTTSSNNL